MVVNDVGKMVCGQVVCTFIQDFVVQNAAVDAYVSANHVVHMDVLSRFNQETYHVWDTCIDE